MRPHWNKKSATHPKDQIQEKKVCWATETDRSRMQLTSNTL